MSSNFPTDSIDSSSKTSDKDNELDNQIESDQTEQENGISKLSNGNEPESQKDEIGGGGGGSNSSSSSSYSSCSSASDSESVGNEIEFPFDFNFDIIEEQMRAGVDLRPFLSRIIPDLPEDVSQATIYEIIMELFLPFRRRNALAEYQSLDDAVDLIHKSKNILVLTGAGISVSCGIPDFRSRNGIYARLSQEFPELPDPQAMFDIHFFTDNPLPFFRFAKEIWPGQFEPSLSHHFIAQLERNEKLLRNYTQNIDSLEHLCPITRLIQCHGSFSTATCRHCKSTVQSDEIKEEILQQKIPRCSKCPVDVQDAILKPDIVFFGEDLPNDFHNTISSDKEKCDLLIVMGSSLKVKPVSLVSELLPASVPQILINRESLPHKTFDIELLGNCDTIINELCVRLLKLDASFGEMKLFNPSHQLQEVPYEIIRTNLKKHPRKKLKKSSSVSPERKETKENNLPSSSPSSSADCEYRSFSSVIASTSFNPDLSYISYPPRRYVFTGAEITFSSDDDDSSGDEEDLPRKHPE